MRGDLSLLDFLDADFTYVNERLARHYGIPGIKGEQFRRVKLKDRHRGGLITQASILTVTSNPTRTSPVKRGKWVLEQLLGTPPPPPPPNVPTLKEDQKALTAATVRLRMEQHRAKASCAVCHSKLDPLGFGLENFDAVGGWRDNDGGVAVDSSGTLPSGESFRGPARIEDDPQGTYSPVHSLPDRKDADLRAGPWAGGIRPVRRRPDREGAGGRSLPLFDAGAGHHQKRPIPETARSRMTAALRGKVMFP